MVNAVILHVYIYRWQK